MSRKLLFRIFALAAFVLVISPFFALKTQADHPSDKQYTFHWTNNETVSVSGPPFFTGNFNYVDQESNDATFRGTFNMAAMEGCDNSVTIQFFVDRDAYESPSPGTPSSINGGTYVNGDSCDYVDGIIDHFNSGDANVGFTSSTDLASFSGQTTTETADASGENSCEQIGALGWIVCPVVLALDTGFNFLDEQISKMLELDQSRYNNTELQQAAGNIRRIAFIILIPIMLVMVLGTALGFEFVSAYTIKRALPRLVAAVIFIALSFPLLTFFIQLVDAIGAGTLGIMMAPFANEYTVSTMSLADIYSVNSLPGGVYALAANGALGLGLIVFLIFFWPVILLSVATAFLFLIARQIFIVGLLLVAPLAILAWIFPGNDKLWKNWWGAFSKLLFVYPLIMGVIAMGRIFAILLARNNGAGLEGAIVEPVMVLLAYAAPYAFIPFSFKVAGGLFGTLTGMVTGKEKGFFDKQRAKRADKYDRKIGRKVLSARGEGYRRLNESASMSNRTRFGRGARRLAARGIGGQNIEAQLSSKTAEVGKEVNDMIATGKDDAARGAAALHSFKAAKRANWDGKSPLSVNGQEVARVEGGKRQYKTLGGYWADEADVLEGNRIYGKDRFAQQAIVGYEMRKATQDGQVENVAQNYRALAKDGWGMTDTEAAGAWIGSSFQNAGQHLEFKHTDWQSGQLKGTGSGLVQEVFDNKGSYQLSQGNAHTISQIEQAYDNAENIVNTGRVQEADGTVRAATADEIDQAYTTVRQTTEIARTFSARSGIAGVVEDGDTKVPVGGVASTGSAAVDSAVQSLATRVGITPGEEVTGRSQPGSNPPSGSGTDPRGYR